MSYKANAMARELGDKIAKRLPDLAVTYSAGASDGFPMVRVGTGVAGDPGALIKIRPIEWALAKNALNLTAEMFSPHVAQFVIEADDGAGTDPNSWAEKLAMLGEVLSLGCLVQVYESATGDEPAEAEIIADNLVASYNDLYWQSKASQ